jgi:hypothetical protein
MHLRSMWVLGTNGEPLLGPSRDPLGMEAGIADHIWELTNCWRDILTRCRTTSRHPRRVYQNVAYSVAL